MPILRISASADILAPAPVIYELIADYKAGHPSILPPVFESLEVMEGGRGAGTRIRYTIKAFGSRETSHARITEPEPGHVLVETVEERDVVTTFTVAPQPGGKTRVTIATAYNAKGVRGWIEMLMVPGFLKKTYVAELQLIAQRATTRAQAERRMEKP
jgi:hypothetical protein